MSSTCACERSPDGDRVVAACGMHAEYTRKVVEWAVERALDERVRVPMILHCPECRARHIDKGEFATKVHHTHACQNCGFVWRPAVAATVGVQFLSGFKDEEK